MLLRHCLSFAIVPSKVERAQVGLIRDQLGRVDSGVANDRLHVTLAISEDSATFPEAVADRMLKIGADVSADPFMLSFDRVSGSGRSVALRMSKRSSELHDVQRQLGQAISYWAIARPDWSFSPHVTLAYCKGDPFIRPMAPIAWKAREIVLIHSLVGESRYAVLGRWPLRSDQLPFGEF